MNFGMSNNNMQQQSNYYGQDNNSMMQNNSGMNTGFVQNQSNQFNMSMQANNGGSQLNNMAPQMQNNMMQQQQVDPNLQMAQPDGQTASAYTSYEDLPNYPQDIDLNQVVEQMKALFEDKSHWKPKFDAIDNLRILNKYHFTKMNEIIGLFWNYIHESFESQKTFVVKNILMFSTEAFMNAREVRLLDEVVMFLIPQVLNKSISEKSIIKKEAEGALCNLFSNCCYDSAIITLSKCCFEKNPAVCEVALATLGQMIGVIGDKLPVYKFETIQILMLTLGKIMDSAKKGNMKKWATDLCIGMDNRFGRENYQELVLSTVAIQRPDLAQYLAKAIEDKKEVKHRDSNFHDFRQEKRKTMKATGFGMNPMKMGGGFQGMDSFNDSNVLKENQYGNMNMNHMQGMNGMNGMHSMQGMQGLHQMQGMQSMNMQNMQNTYMQQQQQPSMGGLFNGQMGLNFPQNY